MKVDIGVFVHNEEATLASMLEDLLRLQWPDNPDLDLAIHVLANGCTDGSVAIAKGVEASAATTFSVAEFEQGGKSRTWNRYVHEVSRADAELLLFMDGDIRFPDPTVIDKLVSRMRARPELVCFSSRPVKDIVFAPARLGLVERLIASGGGELDDYRTSICGQLYALDADAARRITLPVGLPVEDGFVRAMVLTDLLSGAEDLDRIDGDPEVFHVYESLRTPGALVRHQMRIVLGSAVNAALFGVMRREAPTEAKARAFLQEAAEDDAWLSSRLKQALPRFPYGYVPLHFLTKRLGSAWRAGRWPGARGLVTLFAGLALDVCAYMGATFQMIRGRAAGYW